MATIEVDEKDVRIKTSSCQKCGGWIRRAVEHEMTISSKKEFAMEVLKYNLSVSSVSLGDYRKDKTGFCTCKK